MKSNWQKTLIKYAVCALLTGGLVAWVISVFGLSGTKTEKFKTLCDAFTVPALLFLSFFALSRIAGTGTFDGVGYALNRAMVFILPFLNGKSENYAEYKQRHEEQRALREKKSISSLLVTGLVCLAVALLFLGLYYFA